MHGLYKPLRTQPGDGKLKRLNFLNRNGGPLQVRQATVAVAVDT